MTGPVTVAYRRGETAMGTPSEEFLDAGKNPPNGVIVHYHLPERPEGEVKLTILDAGGAVIREFSSEADDPPRVPKEAGANRFVWDLRYPKPPALEETERERARKAKDPYSQLLEGTLGPRAVPGEYGVRLTVGDATLTAPFTILPDPRLPAGPEELRAQFDLKLAIRDRLGEVHGAVNQIRRVRRQVEGWAERAEEGDGHREVAAAAKALGEKLEALEREFIQSDVDRPQPGLTRLKEKLTALSNMIDESDDAPTRGAYEVFELLSGQVETCRDDLRRLLDSDVRAFNDLVRARELPAVAP